MPEEPTSGGSSRSEELLERRLEHIERENRWWRGGLIAALVFIGLMILAGGRHRRHIQVTVTVPPMAMRRPFWGYGGGPYGPPPPGWEGFGGGMMRRGPGMPGGGPNMPGPPSPQR